MGIQPATPAQYQQIMAVWESSVRATHDFLPENILQTLKVAIREQYLPQLATYVSIDENNQISGFIGVDQHKLEMLFISAAHRGKGIGKQLLNFAIKSWALMKLMSMSRIHRLLVSTNIWGLHNLLVLKRMVKVTPSPFSTCN